MTPADPWGTSRLQATVDKFLGVGSDADLPEPVRFVRAVAGLIRRRLSAEANNGAFAYFLLHPPAAAELPDRETTRVSMLDLGRDQVTRRIWLVNCVANDGLALEVDEHQSHSDVVSLITGQLGLGTTPALVLDTAGDEPVGRYFPNGLNDMEMFSAVLFEAEEVSWERIKQAIDRVHRVSLVTPEVQNAADSLWAKAQDYWSASDAEFKVQSAIKAGLAGAFPFCDIRSEQPQAEGRHDLSIEEQSESSSGAKSVLQHGMIELKVLRSRNSVGTSVSAATTGAWALSGVKQAHAYGLGRHSRLKMTICVDARYPNPDMECLQAALDLASQLEVVFGRWKIYGKSSDYRDDIAAGVSSGT